MSVDIVVWRRLIVDALGGIADEAFQRSVWFGHSPQWVDDPNEAVCMMSDAALEEFCEHPDSGMTPQQLQLARDFLTTFDHFCETTPNKLVAEDVIDDPYWSKVRTAAAELRSSLGYPLGTNPTW